LTAIESAIKSAIDCRKAIDRTFHNPAKRFPASERRQRDHKSVHRQLNRCALQVLVIARQDV
jgi:hypothetical protein